MQTKSNRNDQQVEVRIDQLTPELKQKLKRLQRLTGMSEKDALTVATTRGIDASYVLAAFRPPARPRSLH